MKLLLVLLLTFPSVAKATVITDPVKVCEAAKQGKGAWLDDAGLKKCLKLDNDVTNYIAQIGNLNAQIKVLDDEVTNYKAVMADNKAQLDKMLAQVQGEDKLTQKYEDELRKWYRQPWVMGTLGFAVGAVVAAIVVK
jgi:peptidoglycan hydrolase CwlO-like protein